MRMEWIWKIVVAMTCLALTGCGVIRYLDYRKPALRFDPPLNQPLPTECHPAVAAALDAWRGLSSEERGRYPTPYHVYVDTPHPGTFEGDHTIGLAFSGGGTRGMVFGAACVMELIKQGPFAVETDQGMQTIDPVDETAYVSGVSTGAIPAALFALAHADKAPEGFGFDQWPECFNQDLTGRGVRAFLARPHRIVRDMTLDMNTRPTGAAVVAATFFDGTPYQMGSGLTFGALPATPVVLIGGTIVDDPATEFVFTRLPYRYVLDARGVTPWDVGAQSFESFGSDPLQYPLGEASYAASAFPGVMRSGRLRVRDDPPWLAEALRGPTADRWARTRRQPGYEGIYSVMDGGLIDNRGAMLIAPIFHTPEIRTQPPPLLIVLDAGFADLRPAEPGSRNLDRGWFDELTASSLAGWRATQRAYGALLDQLAAEAGFHVVQFRYTVWTRYLDRDGPENLYLRALCRDEPLIGTPERLLAIARTIGTQASPLDDAQYAAVRLAARFAVWHERDRLIAWAQARYAHEPGN